MAASDPLSDERRLSKIESDLGWIKIIGGGIVATQVAGFWLLWEMNQRLAAMETAIVALQ